MRRRTASHRPIPAVKSLVPVAKVVLVATQNPPQEVVTLSSKERVWVRSRNRALVTDGLDGLERHRSVTSVWDLEDLAEHVFAR